MISSSSTTTGSKMMRTPSLGVDLLLVLVMSVLLLLPSTCHAQDTDIPFKDDYKKLFKVHGALMIVAWCIVLPLGALLAVYRDKVGTGKPLFSFLPNFYLPHLLFQVVGLLLNVVSIAFIARGCWLIWGVGNPFQNEVLLNLDLSPFYKWNKHVKWGLSTLFLLIFQCVLGYAHHLIKNYHDKQLDNGTISTPWKRWVFPSWTHVILGPFTIIIAQLTCIQGLQLYYFDIYGNNLFNGTSPPAVIRFGYSAVIILGVGFTAAYALGKLTQK